tara:strand:+ start:1451 stop:2245 length:795 start_codon:yes stop_codon:yes gene_type:complete
MSLLNNPKKTLTLAKNNIVSNINIAIENNQDLINKSGMFIFGVTLTSFITGYWCVFYYCYWFMLGVLSTVGFGFGLPTGTLFLIPDIINKYNANTMRINNYVYWKSLPIVLAWGIGTAVGELPPYFLARYNRNEYDEYTKEYSKYIKYLKQNSFLFISVMSSWPNITFDFVGMLCGLNNISVINFIIPTIIGKAFIKAPFQLFCVIYFYSEISNNIDIKLPYSFTLILNILFVGVILFFIKKTIETLAENELKLKSKLTYKTDE